MGSIRRSWMPPSCRRRGLHRHLVPHLVVPCCSPGSCRFHRRSRAQHGARNMLVLCAQVCSSGGARGWLVLLVLGRLSHRWFACRRRAEHGESNSPSGLQDLAATAAAAVPTVGMSSSLFMKTGMVPWVATSQAGCVQQQQQFRLLLSSPQVVVRLSSLRPSFLSNAMQCTNVA